MSGDIAVEVVKEPKMPFGGKLPAVIDWPPDPPSLPNPFCPEILTPPPKPPLPEIPAFPPPPIAAIKFAFL